MQLATMAYSIKILAQLVREMGGAENEGHEIAGHENGGPNSRT